MIKVLHKQKAWRRNIAKRLKLRQEVRESKREWDLAHPIRPGRLDYGRGNRVGARG